MGVRLLVLSAIVQGGSKVRTMQDRMIGWMFAISFGMAVWAFGLWAVVQAV